MDSGVSSYQVGRLSTACSHYSKSMDNAVAHSIEDWINSVDFDDPNFDDFDDGQLGGAKDKVRKNNVSKRILGIPPDDTDHPLYKAWFKVNNPNKKGTIYRSFHQLFIIVAGEELRKYESMAMPLNKFRELATKVSNMPGFVLVQPKDKGGPPREYPKPWLDNDWVDPFSLTGYKLRPLRDAPPVEQLTEIRKRYRNVDVRYPQMVQGKPRHVWWAKNYTPTYKKEKDYTFNSEVELIGAMGKEPYNEESKGELAGDINLAVFKGDKHTWKSRIPNGGSAIDERWTLFLTRLAKNAAQIVSEITHGTGKFVICYSHQYSCYYY